MKKLILKWLGLDHIAQAGEMVKELKAMQELNDIDVVNLKKEISILFEARYNEAKMIANLSESLDNRRNEIDGIIETLQNLDNHEVVADLHRRILELENKLKVAK